MRLSIILHREPVIIAFIHLLTQRKPDGLIYGNKMRGEKQKASTSREEADAFAKYFRMTL